MSIIKKAITITALLFSIMSCNSKEPIVVIETDLGTMKVKLYNETPKHRDNFLKLAKEGFYNDLLFHRVIKGFMIQGGGYDGYFEEKPAASIRGEFSANGYPQNTLKHSRGVLSMARTSDPDSASSQFFIMHQDGNFLDGEYAAFGKLTEGFDVLDKIAETRTGRLGWFDDVPKEPVIIETVVRN